jgi:hypothetical protein
MDTCRPIVAARGEMIMIEELGRLLQMYSQFKETGVAPPRGRQTIQTLRRERLSEALSLVGARVSAETATILADGLAIGKLAITDTKVYLMNNGGLGIKAQCSCKEGEGGCTLTVVGAGASCNPSEDNPCKRCGFILGVTVPALNSIAMASDPALIGQNFLDQLPTGLVDTAQELAKLSYPLADRLALQDQLQDRKLEVNKALMSLSFPVLSLSDALDKFFAGQVGNLMRLAVGDYKSTMVRNLALALSAGTIRVAESSQELQVILLAKDPGMTIDLSCDCQRGKGGCSMTVSPDGGAIFCSGSCKTCTIAVVITGSLLGFIA